MNSEELELSLRTEFESYLKGVLAGIKQDVTDFQRNFEAEFDRHRSQIDDAVRKLSTRFESEPEFDRGFTQSITEHLRLARDEGATITAEAIAEAEKLKVDSPYKAGYDRLREAVKDISSQRSQSAILRSLVERAGEFAPRGAFFIVKSDRFVGWKTFGREGAVNDSIVQEVRFPVSADTVISAAVSELGMVERSFGSHAEDNLFLEPLGFSRPDRMYAIPLVARRRGVAVMYADYGTTGVDVSSDALDTLVRVAGLTVELLAASSEVKSQQTSAAAVNQPKNVEEPVASRPEPQPHARSQETTPSQRTPSSIESVEEYKGAVSFEPEAVAVEEKPQPAVAQTVEPEITYFEPIAEPESAFDEPTVSSDFADAKTASYDVESWHSQPAEADAPRQPEILVAPPVPVVEGYGVNGNGGVAVVNEPAAEPIVSSPVKSRFGDRNVDLPIEVSDDQRQIHNEARRFARLLVSEIKLYNKQQVADGRESNDLYDRLREAVDRSRDMYGKRVKPEVAARFDYFHYELVNDLAEGKPERLGRNYPGAVAV